MERAKELETDFEPTRLRNRSDAADKTLAVREAKIRTRPVVVRARQNIPNLIYR